MSDLFTKIDKKYVILGGTVIGVYAFMRFLLPIILPFALAIFIVVPLHPYLSKMEKRTKIGKGFLTTGILLFFGSIFVLFLWFIIMWGGNKLTDLVQNIDFLENCFCNFIEESCQLIGNKLGIDALQMENMILERVNVLVNNFQIQVVPKIMNRSVSYVKNIGSVIAFVVITLIATILLAKDYDLLAKSGRKIKGFSMIVHIAKNIIRMIRVFFKSQLVILSIISGISIIGLLIGRVSGAVMIGILAGVMDALPFIGTGLVLVPTALWQLIQGNLYSAALTIVTYVACAIMREYLEPKLIGKKMGIYPIGILVSIYAGVKLYGLSGIILGPLSVLVVKEIYVHCLNHEESKD